VRPVDARGVEHGEDVADTELGGVGSRVMRLVAPALPARIKHHDPVAPSKWRDIPGVDPILQAAEEADVKQERGPLPATS
jgi:hypothetical protein